MNIISLTHLNKRPKHWCAIANMPCAKKLLQIINFVSVQPSFPYFEQGCQQNLALVKINFFASSTIYKTSFS